MVVGHEWLWMGNVQVNTFMKTNSYYSCDGVITYK